MNHLHVPNGLLCFFHNIKYIYFFYLRPCYFKTLPQGDFLWARMGR